MQANTFIAAICFGGLAIVIALGGLFANLCAGALVHIFRLFKVGDFVKYAGDYGVVENVQFLKTQLRTADNKILSCPNARLVRDNIISWNLTNP